MLNVEGVANLHDVSANHINLAGTITGHDANLNDVSANHINLAGTIHGHDVFLNDISAHDVTLTGTIAGHDVFLNDISVNHLFASCSSTFSGSLDVSGDVVVDGSLDVSGTTTLKHNLDVSGDVTMDGNVGIGGGSSSEKLKVYGDVNITGNINIDGSFSFSEVIQNTTTINNTLLVSTQLDISNEGTGPALKVSQLGNGDDQDVVLFNAGDEGDALKIDSSGNTFIYNDVSISGALNANGGISADGFSVDDTTGNTTLGETLGVTGNTTLSGTLGVTSNTTLSGTLGVTGNTTIGGTLGVTGNTTMSTANITTLTNSKITSTNRIIINNTEPTLYFKDTNNRSGMIHMNSNRMYFLSGGNNTETWSQINGQWPLYLQTDTNEAIFGGVVNARDIYRLYITDSNGAQNIPWEIKNYSDGNLGFYQGVNPLQLKGFIEDDGGVRTNRMNFTGQHRTFIKNIPYTSISGEYVGLIVCANQNTNISMSGSVKKGNQAIIQNETLPYCSLSSKNYDKSCFGVISEAEDPNERVEKYGAFCTPFEKEQGDTRVYINSVGEGAIWVTNKNGPLESGDYITTCDLPGYGMKQDSEFLANYTVAKITMNCDFNPVYQPVPTILKDASGENILDEYGQIQWTDLTDASGNLVYEYEYNIRYLDASGRIINNDMSGGFIGAYVGCTYHCG